MWSGGRLTKIQATTRPENLLLKFGPKLEKPIKREKSKNGQTRKPKFDNARRLRGIYFIDAEDGEYEETIKNARRKLEVPMLAAMPSKKKTKNRTGFQETEAKSCESNKIPKKTRHACIRGGSWVHETMFGIISTERSWWSHLRQRIQLGDTVQSGAQVYSCASSDENTWCECCNWTRKGRSSKRFQPGSWTLFFQGGYSGSTTRQK